MPKRLCNSRGHTQARFGRIRWGWRKHRMLNQLEKMDELDRTGKLEEKAKAQFNALKIKAKKFLPKLFLRRHQGR